MGYPQNGTLFDLKRKGILTYATTWMNLGDSVLSEIGHKMTNLCDFIYIRCREQSSSEGEGRMVVARGWGGDSGESLSSGYRAPAHEWEDLCGQTAVTAAQRGKRT